MTEIQKDHQISARTPDLILISKKIISCELVDFVVPADYGMKMNESDLDFARKLNKQ